MALFFLFKTPINQRKGLVCGLVVGWSMGTYKMLLGDHFLSHTIITMLMAWLIILLIVKSVEKFERFKLEKSAKI